MERPMTPVALATALAIVLAGCGGDDATGPGSVEFPAIDANVLAAFCVRGQGTKGENKSGTITDNDCDAADFDPNDEAYFETWRVRVASSTSVTFDANSSFDNYLEVYRLESISGTQVTVSLIGENDDRSSSNLNALVTVNLQPGRDYFVVISGYDYFETGPYTLAIR